MDRRRMAIAVGAGVAAAAAGGLILKTTRGRGDESFETDELVIPDDAVRRDVVLEDGSSAHVVERGEGRPLVLLHGVSLHAEVWAYQLRDLADRYRVIACDLRGHGRSVGGDPAANLAELGEDLRAILVGLDLHDAIVVGHSMGGMALVAFCAAFPEVVEERIAAVVFLSTAARSPMRVPLSSMGGPAVARAVNLAGIRRIPAFGIAPPQVRRAIVRTVFGAEPSTGHVAAVDRMVGQTDLRSIMRVLGDIIDHDARRALQKLPVPAAVVVGSWDVMTPPSYAEELAELLGGDLHVFDGVGHMPMLEAPDELALVIDGLAERLGPHKASSRRRRRRDGTDANG